MAPSAARARLRASATSILRPSRTPASDLPHKRNPQLRLRRSVKFPPFTSPAGAPASRSKLRDADWSPEPPRKLAGGKTGRRKGGGGFRRAPLVASARRLAAALWQLRPSVVREVGSNARLGFLLNPGHLLFPNVGAYGAIDLHARTENELTSPILAHHLKNGILHKDQSGASSSFPYCAMEKATKWDPGSSNVLEDVCQLYGHLKLLEDQQVNTVSVMSALQLELEQARSYIIELESERRSAKKKLEHFFKRLAEEKASWRSREHEKVRNIIEAIKDDLNKERKNRKRLEIVNAKLVDELTEAKLSAKRCLQGYEKERKAREIMEEVCDELAKEIGEDKAEVEALKRESMKLREEVDEERRMLQMAEVWREERVQMKLVDAKLTLDEKYLQLCKLQADIDAFLKMQSGTNIDLAAVKEAEMLKQLAGSVKVQDIKEFCYQPPASDDIFSVFKELQPREETNGGEIEQCYGYSPPNHASNIHIVSPETDVFHKNPSKYANGTANRGRNEEDDSDWETVSQVEEQASCNSPEGSEPSVNGIYEESHASASGTDWDERRDNGKLNSEISEICSTTAGQCRKKSIGRFWRSSCPSNGHNKNIYVEFSNGRLSNCRMSNATISSDVKSGEAGLSSPSVGQRSPESLNPHITRGIKGCIEWPRGMQKHSLKAKLLEARMESQKIQLRQAMKQKDLT